MAVTAPLYEEGGGDATNPSTPPAVIAAAARRCLPLTQRGDVHSLRAAREHIRLKLKPCAAFGSPPAPPHSADAATAAAHYGHRCQRLLTPHAQHRTASYSSRSIRPATRIHSAAPLPPVRSVLRCATMTPRPLLKAAALLLSALVLLVLQTGEANAQGPQLKGRSCSCPA